MTNYEPKHKNFSHQRELFDSSRHLPFQAVFWEQGTGKSKATIDLAASLWVDGDIDGLFIIAPNGVHSNWILREIPAHLPDAMRPSTKTFAYRTRKSKTLAHKAELGELLAHKGFAVLSITYDAFLTEDGKKAAWEFMRKRRVLYVLDESGRIKNPKAKRTKSILKSAKFGHRRRILSGTPMANGPFDLFSQMKFLKEDFWKPHGLDNYVAFKNHFGLWKKVKTNAGREFPVLVSYRNMEELSAIIAPHSSRVLKEDVLDLPPKLYSWRLFDLSPEQERMYEEMKTNFLTMLHQDGECPRCGGSGSMDWEGTKFVCDECVGSGRKKGVLVTAQLAITRMLRLQQILCGYVPDEMGTPFHDLPGGNPRLEALAEIAEDLPHQAIIWARFRRDIDKIVELLGDRATRYDGAVDDKDLERAIEQFQAGEKQFFVANPAKGSEGLTLTNAKTVVYYNNSFKLIERLQSEDRAHRIGQTSHVNYIDIAARGTIDEYIIDALRKKRDVASSVLGDDLAEWLVKDFDPTGLPLFEEA